MLASLCDELTCMYRGEETKSRPTHGTLRCENI
jgi:hypothetical protein